MVCLQFCAREPSADGELGLVTLTVPAERLRVPKQGLEEEEEGDPEQVRLCQAMYCSQCPRRRGASH